MAGTQKNNETYVDTWNSVGKSKEIIDIIEKKSQKFRCVLLDKNACEDHRSKRQIWEDKSRTENNWKEQNDNSITDNSISYNNWNL